MIICIYSQTSRKHESLQNCTYSTLKLQQVNTHKCLRKYWKKISISGLIPEILGDFLYHNFLCSFWHFNSFLRSKTHFHKNHNTFQKKKKISLQILMISSNKITDLQKKNMIRPKKKLKNINLFHTINFNLETKKVL